MSLLHSEEVKKRRCYFYWLPRGLTRLFHKAPESLAAEISASKALRIGPEAQIQGCVPPARAE